MAIRVPEPRRNSRLDALGKAVIAFAVAFFAVGVPVVLNPYFLLSGGLSFIIAVPFFIGVTVYYASKPLKSEA